MEGPPGEGEAVEPEDPPVELREVEEEGPTETPQEMEEDGPKETPQEVEGCSWTTPHGEWEQEDPPVEPQEVEEGWAKETPQELEGCAWETPHGHGDGMAVEAVEEDRKDNGRDHEEAREPPTEDRTWRRPNPAPQESPHETKIPAAQRYHPEKTPLMPWHAGPKTERAHPGHDERRREGDHEDVKEALHDADPIGSPRSDVVKNQSLRDPEGEGGEGQPEQPAWGQKQWSCREMNPRGGLGNETEGSPAVKKTPHCPSGRWSTGREDPRSQPPHIDRRETEAV